MSWTRTLRASLLAAALGFAGFQGGEPAHAYSGSVNWGFYFGGPGWWYYPAPFYYPLASPYYSPWYYPGYGYPEEPMTYVEQAPLQPRPAERQTQWWYYCAESNAYYPYVNRCPGEWQRVSPTPPGM